MHSKLFSKSLTNTRLITFTLADSSIYILPALNITVKRHVYCDVNPTITMFMLIYAREERRKSCMSTKVGIFAFPLSAFIHDL